MDQGSSSSSSREQHRNSAQADDPRRDEVPEPLLRALWHEARVGQSFGTVGEFMEFFARFCRFHQQQHNQKADGPHCSANKRKRDGPEDGGTCRSGEASAGQPPPGFPARYDGRYRVNLTILLDEVKLCSSIAQRRDGGWARRDGAVAQMRLAKLALSHFIDFHQRKRFKRTLQVHTSPLHLAHHPVYTVLASFRACASCRT
jgi:hypothetical protein